MVRFFKNITKQEWQDAIDFFQSDPFAIKYRKADTQAAKANPKQGSPTAHSFVKMQGKIYALNNTKHQYNVKNSEADAGVGGFGRVKFGVSQDGERIALKIEGEIKNYQDNVEASELNQVEALLGGYKLDRKIRSATKNVGHFGRIRAAIEIYTREKVLTAFVYKGDRDLYTACFESKNKHLVLRAPINLIYALKIMMGIEALHQKRIIHRDIKAENFVLDGKGVDTKISPIDFDHSAVLPLGKKFVYRKAFESVYTAPECLKFGQYSFASDVYALGILLQGMGLPKPICDPMMHVDPRKRITLPRAMESVAKALKAHHTRLKQKPQVLEEYAHFKQNAQNISKNTAGLTPSGPLKSLSHFLQKAAKLCSAVSGFFSQVFNKIRQKQENTKNARCPEEHMIILDLEASKPSYIYTPLAKKHVSGKEQKHQHKDEHKAEPKIQAKSRQCFLL